MTIDEVKELDNNYNILQGSINRLHVSDDKEELSRLYNASIYYIANILRLRIGGNYEGLNISEYTAQETFENLKKCVTKEYTVAYGVGLLGRLFDLYSERMKEFNGDD